MDIIFDLSDASGAVVGTMTRALVTLPRDRVELLGVRFRPGEAPAFLEQPAQETRDDSVALGEVWGALGRELADRLACAPGWRTRMALLERYLVRRLASAERRGQRARGAIARVLESRGDLRIDDLSLEVELGRRQLERAFQDLVGVTPKAFARIVRFRAVMSELGKTAREPRWAELAATFGYFDQAHLVREFQALAGLPPGALVRERATSHLSNTLDGPAPMVMARPPARGTQREDRERDTHPDRGAD